MNAIRPTRNDGLMDVVNSLRPYANTAAAYGNFFLAEELYESDGIAATIVDKPADDAVSCGFTIEGDEGNFVLNEFDRIDATVVFTDAIRWARLHGAAGILLLVQDGRRLDEEINIDNINIVEDLVAYRGTSIFPEQQKYSDPQKKNYGQPIFYRLTPEHGDPFIVHENRLLKFGGDISRGSRISSALPWAGNSVLHRCRRDLERYRTGLWLAEQIMRRKQQAVHAMAGLSEMLATDEGQSIVQKKIALTDAVRGVLNGITIDGGPGNGQGDGDKFNIIDLSLGGIREVLGEYRDALAASSKMPQTILFGSDIKGLGSTGIGEQSIYHSVVRSIHERMMRPAIEYLAGLLWAQRAVAQIEPETWQLQFGSLFSPSAKEMAEVEDIKARTKKTVMEAITMARDIEAISLEEGREATDIAFPEMLLKDREFKLPDDPDPDPNALPAS